MSEPLRIVYMGTPDFAVPSLEAIHSSEHTVCCVVTVPDRKSGRGLKLTPSPVKEFAIQNGLPVLQPEKLREEPFLRELHSYHADLFVVVAFRMLPECVWKMPRLGTINLHASLLPQYRGAAPINWAIMNGESQSGLTTFFINERIDEGSIIEQTTLEISSDEKAGSLHDRMMVSGAGLLLKTISGISEGIIHPREQSAIINNVTPLKSAPKLSRELCRIQPEEEAIAVYNRIRGLSPYPGAWMELTSPAGEKHYVKILDAKPELSSHSEKFGTLHTDGKTQLKMAVKGGWISLLTLQLSSRKAMSIAEFLRGFSISSGWYV